MGAQNRAEIDARRYKAGNNLNMLFPGMAMTPAERKAYEEKQKQAQWQTDTGNRLTSMQKQLDELSAFQKQRQEFMPSRRVGATTVGQQMGSTGSTGLRISQTGGMSPSARRRMHRAG
jgi:hypothetical protein